MAIVLLQPKKEEEKKVTDKTFSVRDVIRIVTFHCTKDEKVHIVMILLLLFTHDLIWKAVRLYLFSRWVKLGFRFLSLRLWFSIQREFDINLIKWMKIFAPYLDHVFMIKVLRRWDKEFNA